MANDTPALANRNLLLIALGLAAVVMVLYNVQVSRIRSENEGKTEKFLRYAVSKNRGEQINIKEDLQVVEISSKASAGLTGMRQWQEMRDLNGKTMSRAVKGGDWVLTDDIYDERKIKPSDDVTNDSELVTLTLKQKVSPGRMLRLSDRVNVYAMLPDEKGQYKTTRIINGLVVLGIDGRSLAEGSPTGAAKLGDEGLNTYKTLQVAVKKDLVPQIYNIMSYTRDESVWVTIRNSGDRAGSEFPDGEINPALPDKFKKVAAGGGN